jgi:hypothetical protein
MLRPNFTLKTPTLKSSLPNKKVSPSELSITETNS